MDGSNLIGWKPLMWDPRVGSVWVAAFGGGQGACAGIAWGGDRGVEGGGGVNMGGRNRRRPVPRFLISLPGNFRMQRKKKRGGA